MRSRLACGMPPAALANSSGERMGLDLRASSIFSALRGPMPGRAQSSATPARLTWTFAGGSSTLSGDGAGAAFS